MGEHQVLENPLGQACRVHRLLEALSHQDGLRRMLEDHGVAGDQRRGDRVDRGHEGVIPGRHHEDQAERLALDHALEARAVVIRNGRSQAVLGDTRHIAHSLLETAEFAAVAHRPAHLLGEFRDDFLVHRQHGVEELQDIGATLLDGEPAPFLLGLAGRGQGRVDLAGAGGRATHQLLAVDGGDTDDVGHD